MTTSTSFRKESGKLAIRNIKASADSCRICGHRCTWNQRPWGKKRDQNNQASELCGFNLHTTYLFPFSTSIYFIASGYKKLSSLWMQKALKMLDCPLISFNMQSKIWMRSIQHWNLIFRPDFLNPLTWSIWRNPWNILVLFIRQKWPLLCLRSTSLAFFHASCHC